MPEEAMTVMKEWPKISSKARLPSEVEVLLTWSPRYARAGIEFVQSTIMLLRITGRLYFLATRSSEYKSVFSNWIETIQIFRIERFHKVEEVLSALETPGLWKVIKVFDGPLGVTRRERWFCPLHDILLPLEWADYKSLGVERRNRGCANCEIALRRY